MTFVTNPRLYPDGILPPGESSNDFYTRFCLWASTNDFNKPEFLLPKIVRKTTIQPFRFERRFAASGAPSPSAEDIAKLQYWDYQIEWPGIATRGIRQDRDYTVHRYRSSLLVDLAAEIAGPERSNMSLLDVACHCGILAFDFAEAGFGQVKGFDLHEHNLDQARFLQSSFNCPPVEFEVANARNLRDRSADVVFCGGLLYHVTFPVELLADLFAVTNKFLVFDTMCQNHPFSGFHIIAERNVARTLDGDNAIEFMPTYRAVIDLMRAAGFQEIYEVLGDGAADVPFYRDRSIRSFVAAKPGFTVPAHLIS